MAAGRLVCNGRLKNHTHFHNCHSLLHWRTQSSGPCTDCMTLLLLSNSNHSSSRCNLWHYCNRDNLAYRFDNFLHSRSNLSGSSGSWTDLYKSSMGMGIVCSPEGFLHHDSSHRRRRCSHPELSRQCTLFCRIHSCSLSCWSKNSL